jgi:hypothetical protein
MCSVTAQGGPYARFRRALASGNPTVATAAAAELPKLALADALALLLLYSRTDRRRFERAAVRWHGRLCLEARRLSPTDAALALAALGALGDGQPGPPGVALAELLAAYGLAREADVVRAWLRGSPD